MKFLTVISISILSSILFAQEMMGSAGFDEYIYPGIKSKIIQINGSETAVNAYKSETGQKLRNDIQKSRKNSNVLTEELNTIISRVKSLEYAIQSPDITKEEKELLKTEIKELKNVHRGLSKDFSSLVKDITSSCDQYEEKYGNKFYTIEGTQKSMLERAGHKCKENEKMAGTDNTDNPCMYPLPDESTLQKQSQCTYPGMMGSTMKPQKLAVCVDKNNKITASAFYSNEKQAGLVPDYFVVQNQSRFKFNGNKIIGVERESASGKIIAEYEGSRTKVTTYENGKKTKECHYESGNYPQVGSEKSPPGVQ